MLTAESPQLQDAVSALQAADDALRSGDLGNEALPSVAASWLPELASRATSPLDGPVLLVGASALVEQGSLVLMAAQSSTPLSGGLVPADDWPIVEFGATKAGLPPRQPYGRVIMASASRVGRQFVGAMQTKILEVYRRAVGDDQ
jgi:hypothetical protein